MNDFMSTTSLHAEPVLTRRAAIDDAERISVLARLDDKRVPAGPFLVADVAGEIVAAVSLSCGTVVADPFRLTADAVAMLRLRATQLGKANTLGGHRFARRHHEPQLAVAA
jgi:hypothetical protein